ncbi:MULTISPECIES: hypothetical protein [Synechococcus]|uniref:hypothetical protein n=1 Tax=Synechococcus TaxID=1129 RepID=UPI0009C600EB|nr:MULTISPECIES: hypothetical protein [Synechococcus]MCF8134987.1 hypothetical protein [Synechococcus lacustris]NBP31833.1 hypothetical protein [Synechococcaceae bacterium WB6_1B_055]NBR43818.1 hypothetical protein [Synechococcaceae bacterium WB5_2B_268]NBV69658.1 hypothetical protein [Synechococcaceae bacterium WB4_2_0805]NCY13778.1 hypothetical protein [Synechococcaceae bacterium WB8_1A_041]NDE38242.1 hypothetical protein [Synechococcaceae bacterium WBA_2_066]NDG00854.1 hypothetical protei
MTNNPSPKQPNKPLHPLPKGLVELYGLLAVLFVLVPEWLAGNALAQLQDSNSEASLPATSAAWKRVPELMLASLSMLELRALARSRRLYGYQRQLREHLTLRLLKQLRKQR